MLKVFGTPWWEVSIQGNVLSGSYPKSPLLKPRATRPSNATPNSSIIFLHAYIYPSGSVPTAHESLSSSSSSSSSRKRKLDCPAAAAAAVKGAWLAKEAPAEAKEAPEDGDQNWTCVWCTASNPSLYLLCGQCYREKNLRFEACTVSADMCELRHYHTTGVPKYCKNFHEKPQCMHEKKDLTVRSHVPESYVFVGSKMVCSCESSSSPSSALLHSDDHPYADPVHCQKIRGPEKYSWHENST